MLGRCSTKLPTELGLIFCPDRRFSDVNRTLRNSYRVKSNTGAGRVDRVFFTDYLCTEGVGRNKRMNFVGFAVHAAVAALNGVHRLLGLGRWRFGVHVTLFFTLKRR